MGPERYERRDTLKGGGNVLVYSSGDFVRGGRQDGVVEKGWEGLSLLCFFLKHYFVLVKWRQELQKC